MNWRRRFLSRITDYRMIVDNELEEAIFVKDYTV